jgi:hypothetical protein
LADDDRATLLALLRYQRESFVRKVSGIDDSEGATPAVSSGTSLLWLTNHMADAETMWVLRRFVGLPSDPVEDAHAFGMDDAIARYRRVCGDVDAVIDAVASLDQPCPPFDAEPVVNVRWILAHLLEETARHAGHADILRELINGETGR